MLPLLEEEKNQVPHCIKIRPEIENIKIDISYLKSRFF
jgi:hypothetical protein